MWLVYHRQTGHDEYSRQAMVASMHIEVEHGHGGHVWIDEGEYTSEGFRTQGLDPRAVYMVFSFEQNKKNVRELYHWSVK